MGFLDTLGNLVGISSARDNQSAQRATDATNQQLRDGLGNYQSGLGQDQALNNQLGNTNYYGNAQQVYAQQQGASNMLQQAANGSVPSAAAIQMGVGQQAANAGLQSAALSQQGAMNPALAARNMLNAQAQAQQGIVADGTAQRAQEQAIARQQYAAQIGQMQQQQQQLGQLQYAQGQNMLQNSNLLHNQGYQANMGTAGQIYQNQTGNIAAAQQAAKDQANALGNTFSAAASAVTAPINPTSMLSKVAPK